VAADEEMVRGFILNIVFFKAARTHLLEKFYFSKI